jgi:hypothetical protein
MRSADSGGITMHEVAAVAVYPPSRPTMPWTPAPTFCASSMARTMFGDTLRSRSPPPTEKTNRASSTPRREPSSQPENTVSQPSSLARAVSSDTLSVGA